VAWRRSGDGADDGDGKSCGHGGLLLKPCELYFFTTHHLPTDIPW
jgi:hypothetical protein